jgi:hypothetical protein
MEKDNLRKAFECMLADKKVRITDEGRKFWNKDHLGQWFDIVSVNEDDSVALCGENHDIFENLPVRLIKF